MICTLIAGCGCRDWVRLSLVPGCGLLSSHRLLGLCCSCYRLVLELSLRMCGLCASLLNHAIWTLDVCFDYLHGQV